MKKTILLLTLSLLLTACGRAPTELSLSTAAESVLTEYGDSASFVRADRDFLATNFGEPDYVEESAVYLSENGDGTEFGFFRLNDTKYSEQMIAAVREYIDSERQAVESLAALYPAEELSERLTRFDNATVGHTDKLVYYFITEPTIAKKAVRRFRG